MPDRSLTDAGVLSLVVRARRQVMVGAALLAIVAAACNADCGGGTGTASSAPRSTTRAPELPGARTEVTGAFWDGKVAVAGGPQPGASFSDAHEVLAV